MVYRFTKVQLRSVYKMLSGLKHRLVSIVSFKFFTDNTIPEAIIVVIEVDGEIGSSLFPHFMYFWWFRKSLIFILI